MDYFSIVNLDREPFSNSPDPDFFYQSGQHVACLQKLELALRLKRGLNVVIGAVGAGKTTLCRTLLKRLSSDDGFEIHLILDPSCASPSVFLETIASMMTAGRVVGGGDQALKEQIKNHLYEQGVDALQTVVLVIDEGQKLPEFCFEILRELLNYETNDHKLLQIVLFAQEEFQDILDRRDNLADRVNLIHYLGPMNYADTRQMIQFRVDQAGDPARPLKLFTQLALLEIYRATKGYPRKIINLCHQCLLALIVQNRTRVDWRLVRSCRRRSLVRQAQPRHPVRGLRFALMAVFVCVAVGVFLLHRSGRLPPVSISIGGKPLLATVEPGPSDPVAVITADGGDPALPNESLPQATGGAGGTVNESRSVIGGHSTSSEPREAGFEPSEDVPQTGTDLSPSDIGDSAARETEAHPDGAVSMPALLGTLTVARNDTLGQMLMVVYGDFGKQMLDAVLAANPHIKNADAIHVGDAVRFPAVPVDDVQQHVPGWWLKVGDTDSMEAAYRKALTRMDEYPSRRIIAVWDRQSGVQYGLYVAGYYFSAEGARKAMAGLPDALSAAAEIISGWPDGTVFFSDPFAGKGRHG